VHERMPAIVPREDFSLWLDTEGVDPATAVERLTPAPEGALELVPIGPQVNRFANDDPTVQAASGETLRAEA
jgi:putative SOS response-associated peptidase YedK